MGLIESNLQNTDTKVTVSRISRREGIMRTAVQEEDNATRLAKTAEADRCHAIAVTMRSNMLLLYIQQRNTRLEQQPELGDNSYRRFWESSLKLDHTTKNRVIDARVNEQYQNIAIPATQILVDAPEPRLYSMMDPAARGAIWAQVFDMKVSLSLLKPPVKTTSFSDSWNAACFVVA